MSITVADKLSIKITSLPADGQLLFNGNVDDDSSSWMTVAIDQVFSQGRYHRGQAAVQA